MTPSFSQRRVTTASAHPDPVGDTYTATPLTVLPDGSDESVEEYGNKVYGISVDPVSHRVFVSARDRYPVGLIMLELE